MTSGLSSRRHIHWRIAAADEMHDLEPVALGHRDLVIGGTRHDLEIALHRDLGGVEPQRLAAGS